MKELRWAIFDHDEDGAMTAPIGDVNDNLLRAASWPDSAGAGVVRRLLDAGADVNTADWRGRTPLHMVCHVQVARALLEAGADKTLENDVGETPRQSASSNVMLVGTMRRRIVEAIEEHKK